MYSRLEIRYHIYKESGCQFLTLIYSRSARSAHRRVRLAHFASQVFLPIANVVVCATLLLLVVCALAVFLRLFLTAMHFGQVVAKLLLKFEDFSFVSRQSSAILQVRFGQFLPNARESHHLNKKLTEKHRMHPWRSIKHACIYLPIY